MDVSNVCVVEFCHGKVETISLALSETFRLNRRCARAGRCRAHACTHSRTRERFGPQLPAQTSSPRVLARRAPAVTAVVVAGRRGLRCPVRCQRRPPCGLVRLTASWVCLFPWLSLGSAAFGTLLATSSCRVFAPFLALGLFFFFLVLPPGAFHDGCAQRRYHAPPEQPL